MAEGVLFNIAAGITANVATELARRIRLPLGYKNELRKLERVITTVKAVLLDAEEKKAVNNQVKVWLGRLEDVIYDADNLVDEFRYQQLRRKVFYRKKKAKTVRIFFSSSNQLVFNMKMAKKIKQIREILDEIRADHVFVQLNERYEETSVASIRGGRETHSFVIDDQVFGRDGDKKKILELLLDNNVETEESVAIVSLVGIGGLGKTTLAQFVFNNELVKKHFEKQMWVCVSDVFDLKLLVQKIIRSITSTSPDQNLDLEQLQTKLRLEIQGKRYLLVLDDVWNEDSDRWDGLLTFLKLGAKGSKVLITTRSLRVAQITTHSTKIYMLSGLCKDESWALFERVAFEEINDQTAQYDRLVEIGKDIVDKCKGVPLAIKTIGRLLQSKRHSSQDLEREWKSFRDNELAKVAYQDDCDNIMATLMLSYNNLPSHLKHCFAYCSLFPKDHSIDVQQLIKLWIAQGFIKPIRNSSQLEEIGYKYFMILFWGCFFQEAKIDELQLRSIKYCKMHDLMHDLASLVAGKTINILDANLGEFERNTSSFKLDRDTENAFEIVRHINIDFKFDSSCQIPTLLLEQKKMRTFILPKSERLSLSQYDDILSNFKLLRALSVKIESSVETLPNSLGKLKHLRYLDLSQNDIIKELPDSITGLYNLQTLILSSCRSLVSLPPRIQNLINLRHLEIIGCSSLTHMPRGIGELTSLQTLDMFVVGDKSSESGGFGELSKLDNLHGGLRIEIIRPNESGDAKYLKNKENLEFLLLSWAFQETRKNAEEAFESLEPPRTIKAVEVYNYQGEIVSNWLSRLTNLVRLELLNCRKCKHLPPLHHLPSLKELILEDLVSLEYVSKRDRESERGDHLFASSKSSKMSFFPSLRRLKIRKCVNLCGWWGREGDNFGDVLGAATEEHQQPSFPNLSELEIFYCPLLTSMPLFPNLEDLKLNKTSSKPLQQTITMKLNRNSSVVATSASSSSSSSSYPFSELKHLSIITVDDFQSLLLEAIYNLSSLRSLYISSCSGLASLPEGISNLKSLQQLVIVFCTNLTSLPKGIGYLSSLTNLRIEGCSSLTSIPDWSGGLHSLKFVNNKRCADIPMDVLADYLLRKN